MASKNWHWKTKNCLSWAKSWFDEHLTLCSADGVQVIKVRPLEGDSSCEVGMRKSKLITIYDMRVSVEWEGTTAQGDNITGILTAIEVQHDMDLEEYQFETELLQGSGSEADRFCTIAKTKVADQLRLKFDEFPKALLEKHGKDLLIEGESSPASSGTSTPSGQVAPTTVIEPIKAKDKGINTTRVTQKAELRIAANDLFDLLTDGDRKVPIWTRAPAKIKPEPGAEVSMFGGNIIGQIKSIQRPNRIVMSWRAPTWPAGHFGVLTMTLTQGSEGTELLLALEGVPVGNEEETERNLDIYYIRSLKLLGSASISSRPSRLGFFLAGTLPVLISISFIIALAAAIYAGPTFT